MLELKALTKEYRSKSGNSIAALKNVTLELPEKGLIFIVGKSGCGKTTLLNMIGAVDTPTSGTLSIYAVAMPVTRLVAPGPLVARQTPVFPVLRA